MSLYGDGPCRDCEERHQGCHSGCTAYTEWTVALREKKAAISKARKTSKDLDGVLIGSSRRRKRRAGIGK